MASDASCRTIRILCVAERSAAWATRRSPSPASGGVGARSGAADPDGRQRPDRAIAGPVAFHAAGDGAGVSKAIDAAWAEEAGGQKWTSRRAAPDARAH